MAPTVGEITENLRDAGCEGAEIRAILDSLQDGNKKKAERLIEGCRRRQLAQLHESQQRIDRLDYLRYQLGKKE